MRIIRIKMNDGTTLLLRAEYEHSQQPPDQTDAAEKVQRALDPSPLVSSTRIILDR